MTRKLISTLLAVIIMCGATMRAATITELFANAPLKIFPTIDSMTRLDMIDYFNSGSDKASKNALNGECRIISADEKQLKVSTSEVSEVEISFLPFKSDTILMVITTLNIPEKDSKVEFFNTSWQKSKKKLFKAPELSDWIKSDCKISRDDIENAFPFLPTYITYIPATNELQLVCDAKSFIPVDDKTGLDKVFADKMLYYWNGKKMEKKSK